MHEARIKLDTIERVKAYISLASMLNGMYDICSTIGNYCVDAKSIMGILSLDISQPLTIRIHPGTIAPEEDDKVFKIIIQDYAA